MTDNRIVLKSINGFNTIFADGNHEDIDLWYMRCKKCKLIYPFQTGFPPVKDMSGELYSYDDKLLLGKYMSGNRINIDYLDFGDIKCPHTEIDLIKGLDVRSTL